MNIKTIEDQIVMDQELVAKNDKLLTEIGELKAELTRYVELGTPDEFASALASSRHGEYPKLLDKYRAARTELTKAKGEVLKLRGVIERMNQRMERIYEPVKSVRPFGELTDEEKIECLTHVLDTQSAQIDEFVRKTAETEKELARRERVLQARKEHIAQLKANVHRVEREWEEVAYELGMAEMFINAHDLWEQYEEDRFEAIELRNARRGNEKADN